jgi:lipopolysaccharide/colanic/teichoic acid biosynthesis glycosyltransferase
MNRKTLALLFSDLVLVAAATLLAFVLRDGLDLEGVRVDDRLTYLGISTGTAFVVFLAAGVHRSVYRFANLTDYLWLSSLSVVIVLGSVLAGFLLTRLNGIARTLPLLQAFLIMGMLIVARVGYRLHHARRTAAQAAGSNLYSEMEDTLVVGVNAVSDLFIRAVMDLAGGAIKVNGILAVNDKDLRGRRMGSHRILGILADAEQVLAQLKVHGVQVRRLVIAVDQGRLTPGDRDVLRRIEAREGIKIDYFADRLGLGPRPARAEVRLDEQALAMRKAYVAQLGAYRFVKRLFDITLSALLLVLLWPVVVIVAIVVLADVGRPLLFWQQRPGQGGRPIRVYKFRTMRAGHDEEGQRLADVQRLSSIGASLRMRRLDELPQLFNILIGDMSFVGPRPLLPIDQPMDQRRRLIAKPGLTGWAQVMGGRIISASDKAALDAWYVSNMSLLLDIEIMLRTVPMILFGEKTHPWAIRQACDALGTVPDYPPARDLARPGAPAPDEVTAPVQTPAPARETRVHNV